MEKKRSKQKTNLALNTNLDYDWSKSLFSWLECMQRVEVGTAPKQFSLSFEHRAAVSKAR